MLACPLSTRLLISEVQLVVPDRVLYQLSSEAAEWGGILRPVSVNNHIHLALWHPCPCQKGRHCGAFEANAAEQHQGRGEMSPRDGFWTCCSLTRSSDFSTSPLAWLELLWCLSVKVGPNSSNAFASLVWFIYLEVPEEQLCSCLQV